VVVVVVAAAVESGGGGCEIKDKNHFANLVSKALVL
jgi:hypothetical protein